MPSLPLIQPQEGLLPLLCFSTSEKAVEEKLLELAPPEVGTHTHTHTHTHTQLNSCAKFLSSTVFFFFFFFYRGAIKKLPVWKHHKLARALQQVVKTAQNIICTHLKICNVSAVRCLPRAQRILKDDTQPRHTLLEKKLMEQHQNTTYAGLANDWSPPRPAYVVFWCWFWCWSILVFPAG